MRKILFRGKHTDTGEWMYGLYLNEIFGADFDCIIPDERHSSRYEHFGVRPETVGQYTGLGDKKCVKIFEGDIVKEDDVIHEDKTQIRGKRYVVKMKNGCWMITRGNERDFLYTNAENVRVIGNIHDNPELLLEELK